MAKLERFAKDSVDIDTADLKQPGSESVRRRGDLAKWIRVDGGLEVLRPLNADERDRALGFATGASRPAQADDSGNLEWQRMEASGNAFAVPVVAHVCRPFFEAVVQGSTPRTKGARLRLSTPAAALERLGAASTTPLVQVNSSR